MSMHNTNLHYQCPVVGLDPVVDHGGDLPREGEHHLDAELPGVLGPRHADLVQDITFPQTA